MANANTPKKTEAPTPEPGRESVSSDELATDGKRDGEPLDKRAGDSEIERERSETEADRPSERGPVSALPNLPPD